MPECIHRWLPQVRLAWVRVWSASVILGLKCLSITQACIIDILNVKYCHMYFVCVCFVYLKAMISSSHTPYLSFVRIYVCVYISIEVIIYPRCKYRWFGWLHLKLINQNQCKIYCIYGILEPAFIFPLDLCNFIYFQ